MHKYVHMYVHIKNKFYVAMNTSYNTKEWSNFS